MTHQGCAAVCSSADARGFTLVEALVALVLVLVIAGTVVSMLVPAEAAFQAQAEAADVQQRLRVAVELIERDLIAAGAGTDSGPQGGSLAYFLPPVLPYRVGAVAPDPPATSRSDVLSLIRVPATAAQTRTATPVAAGDASVTVAVLPGCPVAPGPCGFRSGMTAAIYDGSGAWDLFTVGTASDMTLVRDSGAFGNPYVAGAHVAEVQTSTFYLKDDVGADSIVLRRYDGSRSDLPVVDHIVGFEVAYLGEPQPPRLREVSEDGREPRTTYGPAPGGFPHPDYPPGESCTFRWEDGVLVPRLPVLSGGPGLVPLPAALLTDGPWCPGPTSPGRFDADLLRIRAVRVTLRAEAGSRSFRGTAGRWFARPGTATSGAWLVRDAQARLEVAPRNLALGR